MKPIDPVEIAERLMPKPQVVTRMYHAAKNSRLTSGWSPSNSSADAELRSSLTALRNRSRALVRDAPYAKRLKTICVNNIIGSGIGMQAQVGTSRGDLNKRINDDIESAWHEWCEADSCHTGGTLHFGDLERALCGEQFEAGEVFVRMHFSPFGKSRIPFALEMIEAERMADEFSFPAQPGALAAGNTLRLGVEMDSFYRPVAYWIREKHITDTHAFMARSDRLERVPAEQIIHLRTVNRWPQTRGEPWMHAVIRKLNDMDGYSEAEIVAARGAANYMGFIEQQEQDPDYATKQEDGSEEITLEPGTIGKLLPGEKFTGYIPTRPNSAMDPFMRMMLREVCAGVGPSYESTSRDYAQSNYSSSRLALLDDRDLWRVHQATWIRSLRTVIHQVWLQQAVLARAITAIPLESYAVDPRKFEAIHFKPRGWSWIKPDEEVDAYIKAVRAGFMTVSDVIALTGDGRDLEEVLTRRRNELGLMKAYDLQFDTDPEVDAKGAKPVEEKPPSTDSNESDDKPPARVLSIQREAR